MKVFVPVIPKEVSPQSGCSLCLNCLRLCLILLSQDPVAVTVLIRGPCPPLCFAVVPEHLIVLGVGPVPEKHSTGQVNNASVVETTVRLDPSLRRSSFLPARGQRTKHLIDDYMV